MSTIAKKYLLVGKKEKRKTGKFKLIFSKDCERYSLHSRSEPTTSKVDFKSSMKSLGLLFSVLKRVKTISFSCLDELGQTSCKSRVNSKV